MTVDQLLERIDHLEREVARLRGCRAQVFGWDSLTAAERRVVELVCEGLTNRQAAERLYVSVRTVDTHVAHVFQKLAVRSRTELVAVAISQLSAA